MAASLSSLRHTAACLTTSGELPSLRAPRKKLFFSVSFPILINKAAGTERDRGAMQDEMRTAEERARDAARSLRGRLIAAGMRPTRQRVALGELLFRGGHRHVTAEKLYEEARAAALPVSLATVYNTLHQLTDIGLLREIAVDGARVYFDTNVSEHHHFLIEDGDALVDIPGAEIDVVNLPAPPPGMRIARVDVVVRLVKDQRRRG